MEEIVKLLYKLVNICPNNVNVDDNGLYIQCEYKINDDFISLDLVKDEPFVYKYNLYIDHNGFSCIIKGKLDEKSYSQLKWKLEDWNSVNQSKALDFLEDFVDSPNGTMDDLLND